MTCVQVAIYPIMDAKDNIQPFYSKASAFRYSLTSVADNSTRFKLCQHTFWKA